jgi:hypothetical protein
MKSATFGLSSILSSQVYTLYLYVDIASSWPGLGPHRKEALVSYRVTRTNGEACDRPRKAMPIDGAYSWHVAGTGDGWNIKYTEGPGDREWMEQCDRNYLARLDAEKQEQVAAHKQEREAHLHEAQKILKREHHQKEEAEEQLRHEQQLKALEVARIETETVRLAVLHSQQTQTPATKLSSSEVSLSALQGNAGAQSQLGQMYAGGLDVKLDKKEALQSQPNCAPACDSRYCSINSRMSIMKSATFGLSHHPLRFQDLWCPAHWPGRPDVFFRPTHAAEARESYRLARANGGACDKPSYAFPADGAYSWQRGGTPNRYHVKYAESPSDREWMEQCDRNYLARLDAEKQAQAAAAARKQVREAQLRDAQEKLKREQQLKEEAEEQLKAVDEQLHLGQWHCPPGVSGSTPSSAQVPSASPAGYMGYTSPTNGEAAGTAGIFTAANPNLTATNQSGMPGATGDCQMYSRQ